MTSGHRHLADYNEAAELADSMPGVHRGLSLSEYFRLAAAHLPGESHTVQSNLAEALWLTQGGV